MATFTAGTSFTDGVTGDVTAAKLNALVANATPLSNFITDRTAETSIATDDLVLISDTSDSGALNKMTVANLMKAEITGTINSTAGTITTLNSTTGTITTGVIPTLTSTTLITSGTGTAAAPAIVPTGDTNTGIFFPAADTIAFSEGGAEAMRIDSSGNVGIGTASPAVKLDVNGETKFGGTMEVWGIEVGKAGLTGNRYAGIDFAGDDTYTDYGLRILRENTGANANSYIQTRGTGTFVIQTTEAGPIVMTTNSTERLRIDSSGNITITNNFQTGDSRSTSAIKIGTFGHAIGRDSSDGALYIGGGQDSIVLQNIITSQPTYDNTAAGSTVVVTSAGLIRRTSSSIKYKKDIENLYESIVNNAISNLRPVWYRTKNPSGDDKSNWSHIGLIAEEVNSVEPRLVKYKTVEVSISDNGERIETQLENPIPEDVDYAKLSVILLSEVKAQKLKIASLEARIEALESA